MENKAENKEKEFDTVKFFRAIKEKIAEETRGMTFSEFKEHIGKRKLRKLKSDLEVAF
ncbi:MAG: hypothetical protein LBE36_08670 [Flavobacteriaceae bacterium]|jgi:hypothetical protein|nr:hypothetical protein [Flavobacteriaceae bacterium]